MRVWGGVSWSENVTETSLNDVEITPIDKHELTRIGILEEQLIEIIVMTRVGCFDGGLDGEYSIVLFIDCY